MLAFSISCKTERVVIIAMAGVLYPLREIKDFSELLFYFEKGLNQVLYGESPLSIQLRDVPIFRRIKSKIEHLPFLKDLFNQKAKSNQFMIKSRRKIPGSEVHYPSTDVKRGSNFLNSFDFSNTDHLLKDKKNPFGGLISSKNALKIAEKSSFASEEEQPLSVFDVQNVINSGVEFVMGILERFRKFKISMFNSQAHRVQSANYLLKFAMFILLGCKDSRLIMSKKKLGSTFDSGSLVQNGQPRFQRSATNEDSLTEQFSNQGNFKPKVRKYLPDEIITLGIDKSQVEGRVWFIKTMILIAFLRAYSR
jgi:hypothetical protein